MTVCLGVAQAYSKVEVVWMWSPADGNLLGATSLMVLEIFISKNIEM